MVNMENGQSMENAANLVVVALKREQEYVIVHLQPMVVKIVLVLRENQKHVIAMNAQVR